MSSPDNGTVQVSAKRPRDAAASKRSLFTAAQELFGQKGFERTTIREIGERAGVDGALIARYFGSKADLYIAVVAAERMGGPGLERAVDIDEPYDGLPEMIEAVISRSDRHGLGPILQALIRSDTSAEIRRAAEDRLARRLVTPLADNVTAGNVDRAQLRAEIAISALVGISLGRTLGWFDELNQVSRAELVELIASSLSDLTGEIRP
jgi:AcrR family transcriptional regulator